MNLRDHLREIYDERGELTPALVVEAATPEEHPLHARFLWDDTEAAHRYRLTQAGALIREARVVYRPAQGGEKPVRAFVAIREAEPLAAQYVPVEIAAQDDVSYQVMLREFQRAIARLQAQYGHLKEFRDVLTETLRAS